MKTINRHSEWIVFLTGLILMAFLDPYSYSKSLCLIDYFGFSYCPGEGLGHSIALFFRGNISSSLEANLMGPFVVLGLSTRIILIWKNLFFKNKSDNGEMSCLT